MNQTTIAVIAVGAVALYLLSQRQAPAQLPPAAPAQTFPSSGGVAGGKDSTTVAQPKPAPLPDVGGLLQTAQNAWNDPNVQSTVNWLGGLLGFTGGTSRSVYA